MKGNGDAVDDILAAFSDRLEHGAPRPALDHLNPHDRHLIEDLMRLMETGRRIDPSASAPSLETLFAGTEFADTLPTLSIESAKPADTNVKGVTRYPISRMRG